MSFWSGERIRAHGSSVISDFDQKRVDCNSYRLRMGNEYYCTSDSRRAIWDGAKKQQLKAGGSFIINPGQFGFLLTNEIVTVPSDAMAFISMRSGSKFRGLINVSGFHVDPGYKGRLIFSVFNAGPSNVHISEGEEVFLIWFAQLDQQSEVLRTKAGYMSIPSELINGMTREVVSLSSLAETVESIKVNQRVQAIIFGVACTVFLGLFASAAWFFWEQGFKAIQHTAVEEHVITQAKAVPEPSATAQPSATQTVVPNPPGKK